MHRGTIQVYDSTAPHWAETRMEPGRAAGPLRAAAEFRSEVGTGLILDLGCGPARLMPALGSPVIGVDASVGMLGQAEASLLGRLVCGDLEALPVAGGAASGVFGNFSYQHLPREAFSLALAEAARVLRRGGLLQLAVHAGELEGDVRPDDDMPGRWFTYWTPGPLAQELAAVGFEVLRIVEDANTLRATARLVASS